MLVLDDVARLRQRVAAPRGVIALSAFAVLLVDPLALHSVGAWLSVSAIAAVIWAGRATAASHWGVRALAPAAAATLLTAPITAFAFGTVAPIGVLANLIAIPLGAIVVPGLVIALAVSWVVPGLAALLAAGSGLGLALLDLTAQGAAAVPGGHVIMVPGWGAAGVWLAVAVVAWWLWNTPRRPWLIAARVAFVTTVFVATTLRDVVTLDACRCLTVSFLDVGQGDAAVLRTPNGRWIVIDGGPRIPGSDAGRRVVVVGVTCGATRLLFQADAGLPVEGHLAGRVGQVELLKVGHHGSLTATSDAWLGELRPREAVISVGARNNYGHPAPEVLGRLRRWGSEIFRTDQAGTITFTTDGQRTHVDVRHHD